MFLKGDFREKSSAAEAIGELKANGFMPDELDVFSDEPVEFSRGVLDRPSRMSLVAVIGAIVACLGSIWFVYFTQHNYPLITGGMPLFSGWATGVIFYELTMFGAIVTTFFWFLKESGLPRRRRSSPAPAIEPGIICLRIRCTASQAEAAVRCLERAGAEDIREIGAAS